MGTNPNKTLPTVNLGRCSALLFIAQVLETLSSHEAASAQVLAAATRYQAGLP